MTEFFKNANDKQLLKDNKIIFEDVEFCNTQVSFSGINNFIFIDSGSKFDNVKINVFGNGNFIYIGRSDKVSLDISVYNNSIIYIGSDNYYNGPLRILCAEECNIYIGSKNLFSTNVNLSTSDAHLLYSLANGMRLNNADDIFIGNQVCLCDDVKISKGAEIYSNVVIGTKSFVGSSICYSNSVYAGTPVRKVKSNICWRGNCTYKYGDLDFDKWNIIRHLPYVVPNDEESFDYIKKIFNEFRFDFSALLTFLKGDVFEKIAKAIYTTDHSNVLPSIKRIYTLNAQQWTRLFQNNFINRSPLGVKEICNGYILPTICLNKRQGFYAGGVVDSKMEHVAGFKRHRSRKYHYCCEESYNFNPDSAETCNESVIFGGFLVNHFGHFMLEAFSRLWYIVNHPSSPYKYKIVFCTINGTSSWYRNFLELAGIPLDRVVFIDKITNFQKIIIPDESIMSWDYIHFEFFLPYEYMISNARKICNGHEKYSKIYLSKSSYSAGCKCVGEEYFEKFFRNKGFKILYPETLSITEMVYLVSNAKEIVTTLGTLSHYFLFADELCKVVTLTRTHDDTLYPQALINTVKNLNYYVVDVSLNFFYAIRVAGVSLLGITDSWRDFVKDYYGEIVTDETDSKYVFEYLKSFYQMYKTPEQFKFINKKGIADVFKRIGKLFFNEEFSSKEESVVANIDYANSAEYYKYQLSLVKANNMIAKYIDSRVCLKYAGHFSGEGDSMFVIENSVLGSTVQNNHIEGILIDFVKPTSSLDLKYGVRYGSTGQWSDLVNSGVFCGTKGKAIPVTGIRLILSSLKEKNEDCQHPVTSDGLKYLLQYRIFDSTRVWSEWANNGDKLCSSDNKDIFAVQIRLISDL